MTLDLDTGHLPDTTPCKCDNCGKVTPISNLSPIDNPGERLSPGSPVPAGECECGALAYVNDEIVVYVRGGLVQSATKGGQPFIVTVHDYDVDNDDETQADSEGHPFNRYRT